ncbi:MAG: crt 1 [Ilumatobacteraceae bacterium]|nr:crt 1 [Ilumatobacteraceae bacterium]
MDTTVNIHLYLSQRLAKGERHMRDRTIESGTDVVAIHVEDGLGVITLNRPERRNALHRDMYEPIKAALVDFANADNVGCIVITGAGDGFCAGGDVRDGRSRDAGPRPSIDDAAAALLDDAQIARLLHENRKLTIAAVNGGAVGAGLSLALACDMRILSSTAKLIPGWGRLAFSGDFGGTWFLTRLLGPSKAIEILAANTALGAHEALRLGLANHVDDSDDFAAAWRRWAAPFAAGPRDAIALMKANVRQALVEPLSTALVDESRRMVESGRTPDHKEAVRAWLDKREPDFQSRD